MNLALYGLASGKRREWICVDMGVSFGDADLPGIDLIMADVAFAEEERRDLKAILLTHGHVRVDVLPLMVGRPARRWLYVGGSMVALVFCALFLYAAVPWWYEAWKTGQTTPSIWRARLWIPYLSVPVGLSLLCLQFLADIYLVLTHRESPFGLEPVSPP